MISFYVDNLSLKNPSPNNLYSVRITLDNSHSLSSLYRPHSHSLVGLGEVLSFPSSSPDHSVYIQILEKSVSLPQERVIAKHFLNLSRHSPPE